MHLSISNDMVSTKIYFDFEIVNFPVLDGHVPRSTSYVVYISTLILLLQHLAILLTQKLLKQGFWYHKLRETIS